MPVITPHLWFDRQAEDAAAYYVSVFPNSKVTATTHYPEGSDRAGEVLTVEVELDGQPFTLLNGGPEFTFDEAISFVVNCQDQAEIDHYWDTLIGDGGQESQCGWLKDRFGVSWQIVPTMWLEVALDPDPGTRARAFHAVMGMRKLDIAAIEAAAAGA